MRAAALAIALGLGALGPAAASGGDAAGRAQELMVSAARHYEAGEYEAAAADYQRIVDYGIENEVVYYNLGNAQFKLGRLGEAIRSYERSLRLDPRDQDTRANLAYAVSLTVDAVDEPERPFPLRALLWAVDRTSSSEDALLLLVAVYLLGGVSAAAILVRRRSRRPLLYVAAALIVMAGWSGGVLAWKDAQRGQDDRAVVLAEKVDALSGPADDFTPLFTVHEGLRVRVRNRRSGWAQILLPNGLNGWVPLDRLGMV